MTSYDVNDHALYIFENGIAKIILDRPAKIDDGIIKLSKEEFQNLANYFDVQKQNLKRSGRVFFIFVDEFFKLIIEFLTIGEIGERIV